ncbi:hypothetical protein J2Z60_001077 [Lactobacillus colini]|uniref:Phage protein n=1 Tax=Lactobacillus colini TaxID=1819254 RepID=A0ABS4MEV8_9LACO|nr:hypothetical protein [Lactobacillus colini]MBP2057902.1 hypothetical protein [Lactobacillus colini]
MSIITKDPHTWFVTTNSKGKTQTVYNNERMNHNYPMGFEVNFSDTATPPVNSITLYNMSKEHRDFYRKKQKCYVAFNWGKEKKIISEGYITKTSVNQSDGTTDTFGITFTEGTDYSNIQARALKINNKKSKNTKKVKDSKGKNKNVKTRSTKTSLVNKTYKAGTSYKKLIQGIASQSGIKIAKIDLAKNPKLKKAYTAKGKPLTLLKQLVKKTNSKMTYVRGKLEIVNPKSNKRTWYVIDDKDLLQPPTYSEASDDGEKGTWEITLPLVPEITVNVGIKMESKYLKGKFFVKAGKHSSDGDNFQTQCSLEAL